jgi:hypothetical protein
VIYVPIRSDAAAFLSAAIYQLTRPQSVRDERDVSAYYCSWSVHPTRPEVSVLELPESEDIPVHSKADGEALRQLLGFFVPTGEITAEEVDGIADAVVTMAGQRVQVAALIPPSWQPYVMTREQAIALGWLAEPEMPG